MKHVIANRDIDDPAEFREIATVEMDLDLLVEPNEPSLERLANCWNAKHASAMYVPAEARTTAAGLAEYRFGDQVLVGEGTDVFRLLRAIHRGLVWYDPADSIYSDGRPKVRPQWRTASRQLEDTMRLLYQNSRKVRVSGQDSA